MNQQGGAHQSYHDFLHVPFQCAKATPIRLKYILSSYMFSTILAEDYYDDAPYETSKLQTLIQIKEQCIQAHILLINVLNKLTHKALAS